MSAKILPPLALLALLAGTAVFCFAQDGNETESPAIRQLMSQRVEVLRKLSVRYEFAFKHGNVSLGEYLFRIDALLDAELELAKNSAERIALRKSHLADMKQFEESIRAGRNDGKFPDSDLLDATARRLKAEIGLLNEQR